MSVLHGCSRQLPSPFLLHEYFQTAVEGEPDKAAAHGIHYNGAFTSYVDLSHLARKTSRILRAHLRNRILYDKNREPCTKCRHQRSEDDDVIGDITDATEESADNATDTATKSSPVDIPKDAARSRLKSVPPARSPLTLSPGTGSYDDASEPVPPTLEYRAACVIAVDVTPGPDLLVVLLATLHLGAAYLPVDSQSAINRVKYILREAAPLCILADASSAFLKDTDTVWSRYHVIDVKELMEEVKSVNGATDLSSDELNYPGCLGNKQLSVIYTSGSSGMPKGVKVTHVAAMNRLSWQWAEFPFTESSVGCFKTSLLFVDSVVEIFSCLLQLVPLVVDPKSITSNPEVFVKLLEDHSVNRLVMVPSLLRSMLFYLSISGGSTRLPDLTLWVCNSETLVASLVEKFFSIYPRDKLLCNFYGSTETMADVTYEIFHSGAEIQEKCWGSNLSIGRPVHNSSIYLTGEQGDLVPKGEVGELCISGLNIADGYMDDMTSSVFAQNPFSGDVTHQTLYHSGDFGRLVPRGDSHVIVYEGRRDLQVKIRGQRVNITEIERVVAEVQKVERVIVLVHKFSSISEVIVAYYTTRGSEATPAGKQLTDGSKGKSGTSVACIPGVFPKRQTIDRINILTNEAGCSKNLTRSKVDSEITQACKTFLPPYMRPKLLHLVDIPLQPHSGKVDRVALRRLYEKAFNRQSSQELAVLDHKTQKAMNIIALNLNLPANSVSKRLSFFQLGGTSVTMMSTIVQLKQYGLHIPIELFSSARSVQEIIDHVIESPEPIGEILRTEKYEVMMMHNVPDNDVIVDILTESFTEKEPLDVLLGVTNHEFITFARSLYREASRGTLSLIVRDKETRAIVGGDFLFDYFRGLRVEHHETMTPILTLFAEFETPIRRRLAESEPGPLLLNYCLCVHKDLPHAEQVKICHLIEGRVLQVARDNGYAGVVTNNTNPVTQDICQHFYDYEILSKLLVKDFVFNGRKVFAHAPEDYMIKMMIKYT